jgi:hypothetical protein
MGTYLCLKHVRLVGASAALMGTYLCLKHEHLVGASAVLNGHIFVSQAWAFGRS